jgi:hypothetical protein
VFLIVVREREGISSSLVLLISPIIFSGVDFLILLSGQQALWARRLFRAFFILNAVAITVNFAAGIARRNSCVEDTASGGMAVVVAVFNVVDAGQLLALLKVHLRKIRRVFPPVLRYGNASHVLVSFPRPGEKATLVMSDGDVIITPAMTSGDHDAFAAPGQRIAHFTAPSARLLRLVNLWSLPCTLWMLASIGISGLDASRLRARLVERCWETLPPFKASAILSTSSTTLAVALIIAMFAIIVSHGLGRVLWSWMKYWYRRNWVLVVVSFFRGLAFMRQEYPVSFWISSFLNTSVLLCVALSMGDGIILITQSRTFKAMYWFFIAAQTSTSFVVYVTGSSLDNPCDRSKLSPSLTWFVINKIQASVLLFHSIYYLQIQLRAKFEGIDVPLINFGTERFSDGQAELPGERFSRMSRLGSAKDGSEGGQQL